MGNSVRGAQTKRKLAVKFAAGDVCVNVSLLSCMWEAFICTEQNEKVQLCLLYHTTDSK